MYGVIAGASFPGPRGRSRIGNRVTYYDNPDEINPRWALPDVMATSKPVLRKNQIRLVSERNRSQWLGRMLPVETPSTSCRFV